MPYSHQGMQTLVPHLGSSNPSDILRQALSMPATTNDVTLQYLNATTNYLWTPITDRYWTRWTLSLLATGMWHLAGATVFDVIKAVPDTDAGITYSGVWSSGTPSAALNATFRNTNVLNRYIEFAVTPGAAGKIYIVVSALTNGGYANVTIDGATTLVNELPLVSGARKLNCYANPNAYNTRILIASGLDPATSYTVRLTVADERPAGSTDDYVYFEGYGVYTSTINDAQIGTVLYDAKSLRAMGYGGGEWEVAINYKPTGASLYKWTGSGHLNENITTVTWLDALGNDKSVSVGTPKQSAASIILTQTGTSRHDDTGATDHANVTYTTMGNSEGLTIYHRHNWLSTATVDKAYPAMWDMREDCPNGHVAGDGSTVYDLTPDDGTNHGQKRQRLAAIWPSDVDFIAWLYLPNLIGVNSWQNSVLFAFIEDRIGGALNKIYFQRVGGTAGQPNASISIGDIWESTAHYRISSIDPDSVSWH